MRIYQRIAVILDAMDHCSDEWYAKYEDELTRIENNALPHGSGFDSGCEIDTEASRPSRIVIHTSYHHMADGYYVMWTDHDVIVTPSLVSGFSLYVTGRDYQDIKDYIAEMFDFALNEIVPNVYDLDLQIRDYVRMVQRFMDHDASWSKLRDSTHKIARSLDV